MLKRWMDLRLRLFDRIKSIITPFNKMDLLMFRIKRKRSSNYYYLSFTNLMTAVYQLHYFKPYLFVRIIFYSLSEFRGRFSPDITKGCVVFPPTRTINTFSVGTIVRHWHNGNDCDSRLSFYGFFP